MGMQITIITSNMALVSLRTIFHWPPIQSIPSSIVVPCKFLFALLRALTLLGRILLGI